MMHRSHIVKPRAVIAYIIKKEHNHYKFLLMRRCSKYLHGVWLTAGGGLEDHENAAQAIRREIFEETGLKPDRMYSDGTVEIFYHRNTDSIMINPVFVAFIDNDQEVVLSPHEHDAYKWLLFHEALETLQFSEQQRILIHINEKFVKQSPLELFVVHFD